MVNCGQAADRPFFSKLHSHSVSHSLIHHSHTASRSVNKSESEVKKKKRYHFRNALFFLVAGTRLERATFGL